MKNYLVRSSLLFFFVGIQSLFARTIENEDCLTGLKTLIGSAKYRASIDVLNKHLSGILIFKVQEDSSIRTVFINEIGATFFDITFYEKSYTINSIIESMDKKAVRKTMAKDIGMIVMRGIYKSIPVFSTDLMHKIITLKLESRGCVKYMTDIDCTSVKKIENYGRRKAVVTINQFYKENESMPDSIFVQHHTVHFSISLKQFHAAE